jgi:predicted Zn-dependent protease
VTASQLLIVIGIMLLGHELKPAARLALGASLGLWGALFGLGAIFY